ncbi:MAG: hypothetical protein GY913_13810 [Proteobacteria bacterium]|nr:hypothetical protein [Pseudomonadota bacterium]
MPLFLLLGCPPSDGPCSTCELTDANNYSYTSELSLEVVPMAAVTDVVVDWSGLTVDLNGLPVDPTELNEAKLIVFQALDYEGLIAGLEEDTLVQSEATVFATCETTAASCSLSEFTLFGQILNLDDEFAAESGLWLVVLGRQGEQGMAAGIILEPLTGETETEALVLDGSGSLVADIDLGSLDPLVAAPDAEISWAEVEHDVLGRELRVQTLDVARVGRYDLSVGELEPRFAELRDLSAEEWRVPFTGTTSLDLAELEGFPGLDTESVWLLALECSQCTHPAPPVLTVLTTE